MHRFALSPFLSSDARPAFQTRLRVMRSGYGLLAFFGLTAIHVSAAILYKYSQSEGRYEYSPATTLVLAEVFKIFLSLFLHCVSMWRPNSRSSVFSTCGSAVKEALRDVKLHLSWRNLGQFCGLALSYAIYNQCQFLVFLWADAASVVLIRSSSSFVAALMAYFLLKRLISRQQWVNIALQVFGLILVQYDACISQTTLSSVMYVMLFVHVSLSSFNSIWNEHLVKSKTAPPLNVQNAILYSFGALFNFIAYLLLPSSLYGINTTAAAAAQTSHGFFHGYSFITLLIVLLNSFIGITITAVYKYADVIVKTFSLACATGTLFLLDYLFFNRSIGTNVLLGILIVYVASYLYFVSVPSNAGNTSLPTTSTRPGFNEDASPSAGKTNPNATHIIGSYRAKPQEERRKNAATSVPTCSPLSCFCVPDFFIQQSPSKSTLTTFFITYLLLIGYIATNSGDLKPLRGSKHPSILFDSPRSPSSFRDPKTDLFTLNQTAVVRTWLEGPHDVHLRKRNEEHRVDQLTHVMRQQRAHAKGPTYELAICYLDAHLVQNTPMMRWNAELDFATESSFDRFVVHDINANFQYAALVDPIASIRTDTSMYEELRKTKGDSSFCTVEDWVRTVETMNACIDLIEYHSKRYQVSYKWLWIAETDVTWKSHSTIPSLAALEPNLLHMRQLPPSKGEESVLDPSSMLGAYDTVKSFVRQLQAHTLATCKLLHRKMEDDPYTNQQQEKDKMATATTTTKKEEHTTTTAPSSAAPTKEPKTASPSRDKTTNKKNTTDPKALLTTSSFSCEKFASPPHRISDIIDKAALEADAHITAAAFMPLRGNGKACVSSLHDGI